jgi:SAM-dependent methyltransferase
MTGPAMANPFETGAMAEGYAACRPPLHHLIMDMVKGRLPWRGKAGRALDVGCGAGLSTRAMQGLADQCIGIEPAEPMLRAAATTAPGADFVAGRAEAIPLRARSVDLITAAGSLNYTDLPRFFQEAARILVPGGVVVVYDFSPGREFRDSGALAPWFSSFIARYPWPPNEAADLNPERLSQVDRGFQLQSSDSFEIGITLSRDFYLDYMMTETNVAFAQRNGISGSEIRSWCSGTLSPVWGERPKEVLFRGYFACLRWGMF